MTCAYVDDTSWNILGLQLAEHGGLTGWGALAFFLIVMAAAAVVVPTFQWLVNKT